MNALKQIAEKNIVFFDIETARTEKVLQLDTPMFDAWAYTYRKKNPKAADIDVINSYQAEASLYPEFSRVVSVVLGVVRDGKILTAVYDDLDEDKLLNGLHKHLTALVRANPRTLLSGWNIKNFDMPFLFKRFVINGIEPHDLVDMGGLKPWEINVLDLMELWKTGFSNTSLLSASMALGLPSPKNDIDGSQVSEVFWTEGVDRISAYCERDVVTTVNVYRKFCLLPALPSGKPVKAVNEKPEKRPLLGYLFAGGEYGAKEEKNLKGRIEKVDPNIAKDILTAMASTAAKTKTKFTKSHIKAL